MPLPSVMLTGTPPPMDVSGPLVVITIRKMPNQPTALRLRPELSSDPESGSDICLRLESQWNADGRSDAAEGAHAVHVGDDDPALAPSLPGRQGTECDRC